MDLLEDVKKHSSKWMKMQDPSLANFYWQKGYGAFSVDYKRLDKVIKYIDNQHIHHQKQNFQDEYRLMLERYGVEYDERYVWDSTITAPPSPHHHHRRTNHPRTHTFYPINPAR